MFISSHGDRTVDTEPPDLCRNLHWGDPKGLSSRVLGNIALIRPKIIYNSSNNDLKGKGIWSYLGFEL